MIADTGRFQGAMKLEVFQKIVDDLGEFDKPIKVLRMYKDGEPFLNKRLADMVAYAKRSKHVEYIDTTTNGTFAVARPRSARCCRPASTRSTSRSTA